MIDDRKPKITIDPEVYDDNELINYVVQVEITSVWFNKLKDEYLDLPNESWDEIIHQLGLQTLLAIREAGNDYEDDDPELFGLIQALKKAGKE